MCERTQDFQSFVQLANGSNITKKKKAQDSPKNKNSFNDAAGEIARGVHKTSTMLTKLSILVRKQGLFDDPTEDINTLIFRIKQDLDELNSKCDTAQQFIDQKKSFFGSDTTQSSQHNSKVVSHLKTDLMNTTKDFKTVLELRSMKMKDQQQRKVELTGKGLLSPSKIMEVNNKVTSGKAGNANEKDASTALVNRPHKQLPTPYANDPYERYNNPNNTYLDNNATQQQQLLLEPVASNEYYEAREKAVSEVETTIGELGQLFKRLATMLNEQQELVERIDEDVENAVDNTEQGKNALLKAYEKASSNSGMYMKVGGILVIFILFFILFMV